MRPILPILTLLSAVFACAQDSAPGPQSLRSLQVLLAAQKPFEWMQVPTGTENATQPPTPVKGSITEVKVDADSCVLSLKDGRVFPNDGYESVQTWQFKLLEIGSLRVETLEGFVDRTRAAHGSPSWGAKTSPTVFILEFDAAANHKFPVHRWSKNRGHQVLEKDLQQSSAFIVFANETTAKEAEKAVQNAKTFCASAGRR